MRRVSNSNSADNMSKVDRTREHRGSSPLVVRGRGRGAGAAGALAGLLLCLLALAVTTSAQTRYARGQNIVPVFEGWERNPDGSFSMVFGYLNRNYEEEIDIPIGPENTIEPALGASGPDQGQPTHFYTRRQQFVFKVKVPKDWGKKDLVWTLNVNGKPEKAYASLLPFYELGPLVYQENRGATADIGEVPEENAAPSIELIAPPPATISAGQAVVLAAKVTDDNRPTPRRRSEAPAPVRRDANGNVITPTGTPGPSNAPSNTPRRENPLTQAMVRLEPGTRLGVTWLIYRGTGDGVTFAPQRGAVHDNKAETTVTFAKPGTYVVRAYADDTMYVTPLDITLHVR